MKTMLTTMVIAATALTLNACSPSRVAVRERPAAPVIVRPAPPYAGAYWMDGEWVWRGGRYVYIQPHYVRARRNQTWSPGYWRTTPRGEVWMRGHWR